MLLNLLPVDLTTYTRKLDIIPEGTMKFYVLINDIPDWVTFKIYTTSFRLVKILLVESLQNSGLMQLFYDRGLLNYRFDIPYDIKDWYGKPLANGLYYYALDASKTYATKSNVLYRVIGKFVVRR